jgi:hypothetical protein
MFESIIKLIPSSCKLPISSKCSVLDLAHHVDPPFTTPLFMLALMLMGKAQIHTRVSDGFLVARAAFLELVVLRDVDKVLVGKVGHERTTACEEIRKTSDEPLADRTVDVGVLVDAPDG